MKTRKDDNSEKKGKANANYWVFFLVQGNSMKTEEYRINVVNKTEV